MKRFARSVIKAYRRRRAARLIASRRYADADDILSLDVVRCPSDFDLRVQHAFCAHDAGHYVEALARWEHIRSHWPGYAMAWSGYAANARELNCLAVAREAIDEALQRFPTDLVAISEAIRIYDGLGDPARSLELSGEMVRLGSHHPEWRRDHVARLMAAARFEDAATLMEQAGDAGAPELALCRARIASRRGERTEAERSLSADAASGEVDARLAELRRAVLAFKRRQSDRSRVP